MVQFFISKIPATGTGEDVIIQHFDQWIEGSDYFWILGDGLLCTKRGGGVDDDVVLAENGSVTEVEKKEEEED